MGSQYKSAYPAAPVAGGCTSCGVGRRENFAPGAMMGMGGGGGGAPACALPAPPPKSVYCMPAPFEAGCTPYQPLVLAYGASRRDPR
jgi:hypothetical protein